MVMIRNWLLRLFGLSEIVAQQTITIDRLQMQCDWLEQLAIIEGENLRKVVTIEKLWEPNDVY
jgi:hypothetical protein